MKIDHLLKQSFVNRWTRKKTEKNAIFSARLTFFSVHKKYGKTATKKSLWKLRIRERDPPTQGCVLEFFAFFLSEAFLCVHNQAETDDGAMEERSNFRKLFWWIPRRLSRLFIRSRRAIIKNYIG